MDEDVSAWEAELGHLTPEQRQHLLQWLQEEQQGWAEREDEWEKVQIKGWTAQTRSAS